MKRPKNKYFIILIAMALLFMGTGDECSFAKAKKKKKKQTTELFKISPKKLESPNDKSYNDSVTIKEVEFKGNTLVRSEIILENIYSKPGAKFNRNTIQEDLRTIYSMGYFTEKLRAIPQNTEKGIKLRIEVEENAPVTGFVVKGNSKVSNEELAKIFDPQTGLPQNIAELNRAVEEIETLYAKKGYILARVKSITDDPDGTINIDINEGFIDKIAVSGNTKTKDYVIKRNIYTKPGEVYNELLLKQDLSRIFSTQAFKDVRRVLTVSPEDPDKYLLTVEVDEKRTGSISLGGGIDTGTGLFGTVGYANNNFTGRGQQVSINLLAGSGAVLRDYDVIRRAPLQLEASFVEPRLKQTLTSMKVSAYGRDFASYQVPLGIERRIGGEVEFARPIKKVKHLAGSVSVGVEGVKVREGDRGKIESIFAKKGLDIAKRADQLEGGTFLSLGPSLIYDNRNSIADPTDGWYAYTSFRESFALSGEASTFGKATASVRKYFPVGERSTFTLGVKAASKVLGDMPEFATFRLGGANTIRGFREGDVGNGRAYLMASAEYRTPIPFLDKVTRINFIRNMKLAAFVDAGTLFRETFSNQLYNRPGYGITTGMGVRLAIPGLGPIRVDYGYPLTYVGAGNKRSGKFTFGFGDKF